MPDEEELVRCPYNPHHLILKYRMAGHLCKCRKNYTGNDFAICPFNATHSVIKPELQYHIETCSDRTKLDSFLHVVGEKPPLNPETFNVELPASAENWDDGAPQASYLDVKDKIISELPILRSATGQSKAKRREFVVQEIKRFENFSRNDEVHSNTRELKEPKIVPQLTVPERIGMGRGLKIEADATQSKLKNHEDVRGEDSEEEEFTIVLNKGRGARLQ